MKVLILGGYGVFGGRLAQCLSDDARLHLIIAGRSGSKARAFCEAYDGAPDTTALKLDRAAAGAALARIRPDIVVDATGPFQAYGDDPYVLPRAAIAAGVPYLDFADGADFVAGISALDDAARQAGVPILSGVSSFPVLTAAVVRALSEGLEPETIEGGIAPSPYAGIGLNVMRAVVGYAGEPVHLVRDGKPQAVPGLTETRRATIAPPGALPLRNIRFSLVDVPDLQVIPPDYPGLRDIWMGAGPVPEVLHRALNALATLRARRVLPNLAAFAPLFYRVLNLMRFGDHRGGMFVRITGHGKDGPRQRSWHLLAEGDDGPLIPSMAIEILIRKMLEGAPPLPGARPATDALELSDYATAFARRTITVGTRQDLPQSAPLYHHILGDAIEGLPAPVRALHSETGTATWSGRATITRKPGLRARFASAIMGLPAPGTDVPVSVTFTRTPGVERWERRFDGRPFRSVQRRGTGRSEHLIDESFGPFTVSLACVVDGDRLRIIPRRWRFMGLPLPRAMLPGGKTWETAEGGNFRFHVEFTTPLTGPVLTYTGLLTREDDAT